MQAESFVHWGTVIYSILIFSIIIGAVVGIVLLLSFIRKSKELKSTSGEEQEALQEIKQELSAIKEQINDIQDKIGKGR